MATQITHVAIVSNNYTLLARFYDVVFGMKADPDDIQETAFSISDGYVGMNINLRMPGRQAGFDHFGFQVDDVETICARVREAYPDIEFLKRPGNRTFAGVSGHDPAGNVFDLSQHGMANPRSAESGRSTASALSIAASVERNAATATRSRAFNTAGNEARSRCRSGTGD